MSEDHGLRISSPGTDVKTGNDEDMLLTTKLSIPKAVNWEEVDLDSVGNPYNYPHRAEFVPFVLAFATGGSNTDKIMANYYNYNDPDNVQLWVSADMNNVRVEVSGTPNNKKVQLYVFVPEIDGDGV